MAKKKKDLMQGPDVPVGGGVGGAFGERLSMSQPLTQKKKTPAPESLFNQYYTTAGGIEIVNPGQSAESTQVRFQNYQQEQEAADKAARDKAAADAAAAQGLAGTKAGTGGGGATGTSKTSAFTKLRDRLNARGLGSLYDSVVGLIQEDLPDEEFTMRLRETPAYQTRFKANADRVNKGLRPLSEGEYLAIEDSYQNLMRMRGLPESYYSKSGLGQQVGFEKLIASDVSPDELAGRIDLAQEVIDGGGGVIEQIKAYYPEITNGDLLAYVLDPKDSIKAINAKVRSAQIGAEAAAAGLIGNKPEDFIKFKATAESLQGSGTTKAQAKEGFGIIANILPTTQKLASIYGNDQYTQAEAQQEVFGLAGGVQAGQKRRRLASQERAAFSGQVAADATALERGRAGAT
jgi:hypothetical protein